MILHQSYKWSWIFLLGLIISIFNSCTTRTNTPNYAHLYSGVSSILQPNYIVYHDNESSSKVYFTLNSEELLYVRKDKSEPYHASIKVSYRLYSDISSKVVVDSASRMIEDITEVKSAKSILGNFDVKIPMGGKYFLKILTTDINRGSIDETHLDIDKRKSSSSQFFLLRKIGSETPIFTNYVVDGYSLEMVSSMNKNRTIQGRYYNRKFPLAAPPFSTANAKPFKYAPDSVYEFTMDEVGKFEFNVQDSGFVHFQVDTTVKVGFTLFRYDKEFPFITSSQGMVFPLRYICTKNEYKSLTESDNVKKTLDKFWINKTGSKERARELIKRYYNRVQTANEYFTSYIEGWKTDRGMVSMIFGEPRIVNKTRDSEVWIYGEESNTMSLRFSFDKVNNPFTDNDYKLNRGPSYRANWYRAVDAWRSGRVYWGN